MKIVIATLLGFFVLAFIGCATRQTQRLAAGEPAPRRTIHETMLTVFVPNAQVLWDGVNSAMDKTGLHLVASKISVSRWEQMEAAATALENDAASLAGHDRPIVARPEIKIQAEGNPGALGAAQVRILINRDIGGFRGQARELADLAVSFLAAIKSRNAEPLGKLAGELDEVCEECHVKYWYPPPK